MIQRFLVWVLSIAKRWVDDSVAEEELRAFVCDRLHLLVKSVYAGKISQDEPVVQGIFKAAERLRVLRISWLPQFDQLSISHDPHFEALSASTDENCPPVVHQGIIAAGAADHLLAELKSDEPVPAWQMEQMEALLRHIEIRRQAGLRFQPSLSEDERWIEIQKTSLLFTRYAQQQQDYRFLNTALKLNDWTYKYYRNTPLTPRLLHYLQAVLEAEATLLEMTA